MRIDNAADCGRRMPFAETHRNSICYETNNSTFFQPRNFSLATLSAYARDQPHQHAHCTSDPYPGKHHRHPALCHVPYGPANVPSGVAHLKCGAQSLSITAPVGMMKLSAVTTQIQYFAVALAPRMVVSSHAATPTMDAYSRWTLK